MNPVDRLRVEKAAADCGFEMSTVVRSQGLELRSARFPELVWVQLLSGQDRFELRVSDPGVLGSASPGGELNVDGYAELYSVLRTIAAHARTKPNRIADAFRGATASLPKTTDAERLVVQRVGQGLFRDALLDYWQGRCCVTGLDIPELLRASHIRPWAMCETDEQRLDVFNGLLLAPHLDALFDAGLMTFDDDGVPRISSQLTPYQQRALGVTEEVRLNGLREQHAVYLAFHRTHVWRP